MDARKQFSRIGWAFVAFCLVDLAVQLLTGLGIQAWILHGGRLDFGSSNLMLLSQISMYVFAFPVFWLFMRRIPSWRKEEPGRLTVLQFLAWMIVCFGFTYLGNLVGQLLMGTVGAVTGTMPENPVDTLVDTIDPWMMFLTTVLIAPVMEELMFRKFLVDRIVPFGQKTAVVVSGVAFGLFHGNFYQFFYACILGMIFAYLYSSTGRLRYNILLHMIINTLGGLVPLLITQGASEGDILADIRMAMLGSLVLFNIAASVFLACIFGWRLRWFPAWEGPRRGIWRSVLTAPGVIGFVVVCVILFLFT